jgi:hypothetical protein
MKSQKPSTPAVNKWVEEGRTKKERNDLKATVPKIQYDKPKTYVKCEVF